MQLLSLQSLIKFYEFSNPAFLNKGKLNEGKKIVDLFNFNVNSKTL